MSVDKKLEKHKNQFLPVCVPSIERDKVLSTIDSEIPKHKNLFSSKKNNNKKKRQNQIQKNSAEISAIASVPENIYRCKENAIFSSQQHSYVITTRSKNIHKIQSFYLFKYKIQILSIIIILRTKLCYKGIQGSAVQQSFSERESRPETQRGWRRRDSSTSGISVTPLESWGQKLPKPVDIATSSVETNQNQILPIFEYVQLGGCEILPFFLEAMELFI